MTLEREIWSMYQEIVDWNGYFGDPIETSSFNPFELLRQGVLTEFRREGVCVAVLCHLMTAINNSTYEDAVSGPTACQAGLVLRDALSRGRARGETSA